MMALVLGMTVGKKIIVGKDRLEVLEVKGPEDFSLLAYKYNGAVSDGGLLKKISSRKAIEVFKDVWVSAGVGNTNLARVVITAPREVRISRG